LDSIEKRRKFQFAWDAYYAKISPCAGHFATSPYALTFTEAKKTDQRETKRHGASLTEFGDEGEALVYEYEKKRVSAFSARLANKVLALGKTRGIGYDIQSVIAEPGEEAEFVKYIEVKSTKRLTCPDINDSLWIDTLNITRNEWIAAHQHRGYYSIYRVFFTRGGVVIFVIEDVAEKIKDGRIQATPMTYRVDFSSSSVTKRIDLESRAE